ncbi:hypothetical protein [Brevundimonas sp. FT23028]|uniref:hypothetical protein n=1 Tax=Brevundimonas sp. FT23028 TaxID=3393748 RepID=UPI003B586D04
MKRALVPLILLSLAACEGREPEGAAAPRPTELAVLTPDGESAVLAPNSSMRLVSTGTGELLLSAGFFNRNQMAYVGLPARAAWSPDSGRLFVNDPDNAALGAVRVFDVSSSGVGRERTEPHRLAVEALIRMNGCVAAPGSDVATGGLAWAADGDQLYVLAEVRRQTGDCAWDRVSSLVAVVDMQDGRVLEALPADEARARHPELSAT